MRRETTTNARKHRLSPRVLAVGLALLFLLLIPHVQMASGFAFATGNSSDLQAAQVDSKSTTTIKTTSVVKEYPSKQKMIITMAGHDKTTVKFSNAKANVKWKSSNSKIVKVTPDSKNNAVARIVAQAKPGKATVTAKSGKTTLTCEVTVTGVLPKTLELTPLQLNKTLAQPKLLKGLTFKAGSWKSTNTKCLAIDKNTGKLTPKATGRSTITCLDNKGHQYACAVTVKCPAIICKALNEKVVHNPTGGFRYLQFGLKNNCGQAILLDKNLLAFYSTYETPADKALNMQAYDPGKGKLFSASPLKVDKAKGAAVKFNAISKLAATNSDGLVFNKRSDKNHFCLTFKVGNLHFKADFNALRGTMTRCARA